MSVLSAEKVTLRFGGLTAVNNVDLSVHRGEIFAIIGPNGAGKTSLFNVISGVYPASSGTVTVDELEPCRQVSLQTIAGIAATALMSGILALLTVNIISLWNETILPHYVYQQAFPWGRAFKSFFSYFLETSVWNTALPFLLGTMVGLLGAIRVWSSARRSPEVCAHAGLSRTFQNIRLFAERTVLENVLVGMHRHACGSFLACLLRLPKICREERALRTKALELLTFVDLDAHADRAAGSLPYGLQRRLEIARALAAEPKVLLLDEPAAGMNPSESRDLMQLIRRIRDRGITVVLIEHDMKVVMGISDRIAVLDSGEKIAEGTPEQIKRDPRVISAYLGGAHP